jgi:hypothetical protein
MPAVKYDMVRLAELRDAHAALVNDYQQSVRSVSNATNDAMVARLDAPPLPGAAPVRSKQVFALGIGKPPTPRAPTARTNEFYQLPLATILSFTQTQLDDAGIDQRALSRIMVAENRLSKLRAAHVTKAATVRRSGEAMKHVNLFATENRL